MNQVASDPQTLDALGLNSVLLAATIYASTVMNFSAI